NREAARLDAMIRGRQLPAFGVLNRRWLVGANGDLYHYDLFDPRVNHFTRMTALHIDEATWQLASLTFAREVSLAERIGEEASPQPWAAHDGWRREFERSGRGSDGRTTVKYQPF